MTRQTREYHWMNTSRDYHISSDLDLGGKEKVRNVPAADGLDDIALDRLDPACAFAVCGEAKVVEVFALRCLLRLNTCVCACMYMSASSVELYMHWCVRRRRMP